LVERRLFLARTGRAADLAFFSLGTEWWGLDKGGLSKPKETAMIYIALGANLPSAAGPPEKGLHAALDVLSEAGVEIAARSAFFRSPAWPNPSDPPFVNAVAKITTLLSPRDLLYLLHAVETSFGRRRPADPDRRNAPRTLDLDLIDYDGLVQLGPPTLPHPRVAGRSFVLVPLQEIAPDWRHPESGTSIDDLIAALGAEAEVPRVL
jgi:2-amino-4-hydroxy-6-hydroxymethyldihydropteridine diphosphokinase